MIAHRWCSELAMLGLTLGLTLGLMLGPLPATAGVIYMVGVQSHRGAPSAAFTTVPAHAGLYAPRGGARLAGPDANGGVHGVILTGASLTLTAHATRGAVRRLPARDACADCGYVQFAPLIGAAASVTHIDPALVAAVIDVESGFDQNAVSPAGARGLMQLMPATALRLGVSNASDPLQNVAAGTRYLSGLVKQFSGNLPDALAAYNAGEAAVQAYGGIPPFAETQAYVPRVLSRYARYRALGVVNVAAPAAPAAARPRLTLVQYH